MATVLRPPFVVPRPADDGFWQGQPDNSAALQLLTAIKLFGAGGQAPTKQWHYDDDVAASLWRGAPAASAILPLLTAVKFFGAGGQAPSKQWRYDHDVGASFWQGQPNPSAVLQLLTAVKFFGAGGEAPPRRQWVAGVDEIGWTPSFGRNVALLNAAAAASNPFVSPLWKFAADDGSVWQGQPDNSAVLQLLTAVKFFGAGGQAPTKRWSYDYLLDEPIWIGRPDASALLAPLLTAGGQVKARQWLWGRDDPPVWVRPFPVARVGSFAGQSASLPIASLTITVTAGDATVTLSAGDATVTLSAVE